MEKAIFTGGAGFVNRHLVKGQLEKGCGVNILDDASSGYRDNHHP
jgi:nucleoside-diphosphate-sugar epimerase